jgi:hypothetical protein
MQLSLAMLLVVAAALLSALLCRKGMNRNLCEITWMTAAIDKAAMQQVPIDPAATVNIATYTEHRCAEPAGHIGPCICHCGAARQAGAGVGGSKCFRADAP